MEQWYLSMCLLSLSLFASLASPAVVLKGLQLSEYIIVKESYQISAWGDATSFFPFSLCCFLYPRKIRNVNCRFIDILIFVLLTFSFGTLFWFGIIVNVYWLILVDVYINLNHYRLTTAIVTLLLLFLILLFDCVCIDVNFTICIISTNAV